MTQAAIDNLIEMMQMSRNDVLDKFHTIPDAYTDGNNDERFVYIEGTRNDKVLLIAHADTVWKDSTIKVGQKDGILFSSNRDYGKVPNHGVGIGADDRAGCAIAWELRKLGHSILITSGEECGQKAAVAMMKNTWWKQEINQKHAFCVQFDRKNYKDLVFYRFATKAFVAYLKDVTKYQPAESCGRTDICSLCEDICGVNISCGYYNEHTVEEKLIIDQWLNTLCMSHYWLKQPDIKKFTLDRDDLYVAPSRTIVVKNHSINSYCGHDNYWKKNRIDDTIRTTVTTTTQQINRITTPSVTRGDGRGLFIGNIVCTKCSEIIQEEVWFENMFKCPKCGTEL